MQNPQRALGVFDSGIGGLTVANAIINLLPEEAIVYFADTARLPYGTKSAQTIRQYSSKVTEFLLDKGCKAIIVACNTASAAALTSLRESRPGIPFVGMEPAVKPAALASQSGKVGVLATAGTFKSSRYANLMKRFAANVRVFEDPCLGLVELIEEGKIETTETEELLRRILQPMLVAGADTFVLGCTHYPFVKPLIKRIIGENARLIDPALAIARQVKQVLQDRNLLSTQKKLPHLFFASADAKLHVFDGLPFQEVHFFVKGFNAKSG